MNEYNQGSDLTDEYWKEPDDVFEALRAEDHQADWDREIDRMELIGE